MELEPTLIVDKLGTRIWRLNGQLHRTDGPAVEFADGDWSWYLNGQYFTFQEWLDLINVDEPTRLLLLLKYGR